RRRDADPGLSSKQRRQVVVTAVRLTRERQQLQSDQATFFLRADNTVDRILAEGNVWSEFHGRASSNSKTSNSGAHARSDRAELFLTGTRNQLTTAVLNGNVQLASGDAASRVSTGEHQGSRDRGAQVAEASAGRVTLHFSGQQILRTVHAEDGVRLAQKKNQGGAVAMSSASSSAMSSSAKGDAQDVEMTAPVMDFI